MSIWDSYSSGRRFSLFLPILSHVTLCVFASLTVCVHVGVGGMVVVVVVMGDGYVRVRY